MRCALRPLTLFLRGPAACWMHGLRANRAHEPFNRLPRRSLFGGVPIHGRGRQAERLLKKRCDFRTPLSSFFDSLHLSVAQEARDYVRATREQFIAAREIIRMGVGRRNAQSVAMCFAPAWVLS